MTRSAGSRTTSCGTSSEHGTASGRCGRRGGHLCRGGHLGLGVLYRICEDRPSSVLLPVVLRARRDGGLWQRLCRLRVSAAGASGIRHGADRSLFVRRTAAGSDRRDQRPVSTSVALSDDDRRSGLEGRRHQLVRAGAAVRRVLWRDDRARVCTVPADCRPRSGGCVRGGIVRVDPAADEPAESPGLRQSPVHSRIGADPGGARREALADA